MKKFLAMALAAVMVLALAACGSKNDGANTDGDAQNGENTESVDLIVFAAASMTETLNEIAEMYKEVAPNVTLTFNFDSSGKLLTQISEGADCDLFISAAPTQMNAMDGSLIGAYGHDDRVCAYPSLLAQLEANAPKRTSVCILVDKEEIGSVGASGMTSRFFENTVAEIMELAGEGGDLKLRRALAASKMLSSDVSAGFDPSYAAAYETKNAAYLGRGLVFNKYTGARGKSGSNDASAEYMAKVRAVMDGAHVNFQTCELGAVDAGGGGTIAYIPAEYGMDVIDSGVAVLSMHAPWEVVSKADVYEAYKGYKAFLEGME